MTLANPRTYRPLLEPAGTCERCYDEATVEARISGKLDWLRCATCARLWLAFSMGIGSAIEKLVEDERQYAVHVANTMFDCSENEMIAPWTDSDAARECEGTLPSGYEDVPEDGFGVRWVPTSGLNFLPCLECQGGPADIVGIDGEGLMPPSPKRCAGAAPSSTWMRRRIL